MSEKSKQQIIVRARSLGASNATIAALVAAMNRRNWGRWAAKRYALKRGASLGIYRLACQLVAASRAGI